MPLDSILTLDLGGTNLRLALARQNGRAFALSDKRRMATAEHPSLAKAAQTWLADTGAKPDAIGIGIAGPVTGRTGKVTSLAWTIDAAELEATLGVPVTLLNDLEAHGYGIIAAAGQGFPSWRQGQPRLDANAAVLAPGTGLGEAILFHDGEKLIPRASEGGHSDFAPASDEDVALLAFLRRVHHHVSWERVVSGRDGFRNVYEFLRDEKVVEVAPEVRARLDGKPDIGADLLALAAEGEPTARAVLERFARHLGAEAGNLALKAMATGGLYIAGSLATKVFELVPFKLFLETFESKGRFRELLTRVPIWRADDPDLGLLGAAAASHARAGKRQ